jgi:16S rRNA (guanine527-N7)-methyltransferase
MQNFGPREFERAVDVSRETYQKLEGYAALLAKWQKAKNLVSNQTIDDMWRRHFYDSAQLLPLLKDAYRTLPNTLLDIGSGAGFPGLVLGACGIDTVHMVESNGKKCAFMQQVALLCGISAEIHNKRIEEMPLFDVDIITSRACAKVGQLLDWAAPFIESGDPDLWLLKGPTIDEELTDADPYWRMDISLFDSQTEAGAKIVWLKNIERK